MKSLAIAFITVSSFSLSAADIIMNCDMNSYDSETEEFITKGYEVNLSNVYSTEIIDETIDDQINILVAYNMNADFEVNYSLSLRNYIIDETTVSLEPTAVGAATAFAKEGALSLVYNNRTYGVECKIQ